MVAYVIIESPQSQLDLDLGLRGPDLGLGLDNYFINLLFT